MTANTGKHLYNRGWLGLIPLIGAFIGVGLIILGIFRYKDKRLIFIGVAACMFTVVVYSSLIYFSWYTKAGKTQWAELAKKELTSLVKDIEFYKLQHGAYPDSLPQLSPQSNIVWIYDPLFAGKKKQFNYVKVDDRYKVFSSGIDNIPGTSDDLYPNISFTDSSKIGLIH